MDIMRRLEEIHYGEFGLDAGDWRGLILPCKADMDDNVVYLSELDVTKQELCAYLFYWERFVYALDHSENNIIKYNDFDILDPQAFFAGRTKLRYDLFEDKTRGEPALHARVKQYQLFKFLDDRDPGRWAVAESSVLPFEIPSFGRSLLVKLHNAIPVPDVAVRFEDIAEFREKNRDALRRFRYHINALFQKILSSSDPKADYISEFINLKESVKEIIDSYSRQRFAMRFGTFQVKLKWERDISTINLDPGSIGLAMGAGAFLDSLQASISLGVVMAAAQNIFPKIELEFVPGGVDINSGNVLQYAILINNEFKKKKSFKVWPFT